MVAQLAARENFTCVLVLEILTTILGTHHSMFSLITTWKTTNRLVLFGVTAVPWALPRVNKTVATDPWTLLSVDDVLTTLQRTGIQMLMTFAAQYGTA